MGGKDGRDHEHDHDGQAQNPWTALPALKVGVLSGW